MSRIDHAVRDMVYQALLVREGQLLGEQVAWERASNIALAIVGNFRIEALPEGRPDPAGDDERICNGGGR